MVVLGISGNNQIGAYEGTIDNVGGNHAYLYNGSAYTTLSDPLGSQTMAFGVSGSEVAGIFHNTHGLVDSFLYNGPAIVSGSTPEPGSLGLTIGIGACCIAGRARRRRNGATTLR